MTLSSGFHLQTNSQTEHLNQELETGLCLLCSRDPTLWVKNVVWVEYTHNSLPSSTTGLTLFQTVYGYQPPLFSNQDTEVVVPSAFTLVRRCCSAWRRACQTPFCTDVGCVCVCADLPLRLESRKLTSWFLGLFPITKVINPVAVHLQLPRPLRIYPTFHISQVKPVCLSNLVTSTVTSPQF